jgi:hypothetical protein
MSSTPNKPSGDSSKTHGSSSKDKIKTSSERHSKTSKSSSHPTDLESKKSISSKSIMTVDLDKEMDADELVDQILAEDNLSISSMDVSEDDLETTSANQKKRKREESDNEAAKDEPSADTIMYVV